MALVHTLKFEVGQVLKVYNDGSYLLVCNVDPIIGGYMVRNVETGQEVFSGYRLVEIHCDLAEPALQVLYGTK